jgi:DNA transformation protein
MFAILANDTFYLKADATSVRAFADDGMQPFSYQPEAREPIVMSYWKVPPRLLEEPQELVSWVRDTHRIACASKSRPPRRKRRSQ